MQIYSLIDGQDVQSTNTDQQILTSPIGEEQVEYYSAQVDEIDAAIKNCRKAQQQWRKVEFKERCSILEKYSSLILQCRDELAKIISQETGKPFWETKTEAAAVAAKIAISIKAYGVRTNHSQSEANDGSVHILTHRPIGIFALLGPFNFPAHLPNGHIVPALLAGNGIIFKPSNFTPRSGLFIVKKLIEAGVPPSLVQVVIGDYKVGEYITNPQLIDGVLFTGSPRVGKIINEKFASYPNKILALEMGGNNPLIWWDNKDNDKGALAVVQSAFLSAGQRCTCARRLILPDSSQGRSHLQKLIALTKKIIIDKPFANPQPFMGPVINATVIDTLLSKVKSMQENSAIEHLALKRLEKIGDAFVSPGIYEITKPNTLEDEEDFAPLLKVFFVKDFNEAIKLANKSNYGLSAGLIDDNQANWQVFYHEIKAGIVNWNRQTTGASSAQPFGGPGMSGNFRPSAFYAADYCAYPMASVASPECPPLTSSLMGINK